MKALILGLLIFPCIARAGVFDGQAVSAAVSNAAWLSKNANDTDPFIVALTNGVAGSGTSITNIQAEMNSCASYTGKAVNASFNVLPAWTHNEVGSSTDTLFTRSNLITGKFNSTTGHMHSGTDGDGPQIPLGTGVAGVLPKANSFPTTVYTDQSNTYSNGPQSLGTQVLSAQIPNDTVTGTVVNKLAKMTTTGQVILNTTADLFGTVGVVTGGAGTSGNAEIAREGSVNCVFDGATTAGDFVVQSPTVNGDCHDSGSSPPTNSTAVGRVLSTNGGGGTYAFFVYCPQPIGPVGTGTVTSVGLIAPSNFIVSGSPVTTSGNITLTQTVTVQNKTSNYTIQNGDDIVEGDGTGGGFTFTLPSAAANPGKELMIVRKDGVFANTITVNRAGSDTIGVTNMTSVNLSTIGESYVLVSDGGTNWVLHAHFTRTGWQSFTPTGTFTTNTTYTGFWRRSGATAYIRYQLAFAGAPNATALDLNTPFTIDTAIMLDTTAGEEPMGKGAVIHTGVNYYPNVVARYLTTTSVDVIVDSGHSNAAATATAVNATTPVALANTDKIWVMINIPVSGWTP